MIAELGDINVDAKINEIVEESSSIEDQVGEANRQSRTLMAWITQRLI